MPLITHDGDQPTSTPDTIIRQAPAGTPVGFKNDDVYVLTPQDNDELVKDQPIVDAILWNYDEAVKAKKPFDSQVDRIWDRYNNRFDHGGKADWQSKKNFPVVMMTVERLAAVITRILTLARNDWFTLETFNPALRPYFSVFKDMLQEAFRHPQVKFFNIFREAVKDGLIGKMMCSAVTWERDQTINIEDSGVENLEREDILEGVETLLESKETVELDLRPKSHLKIVNFDSRNVVLDPTNRNRFCFIVRKLTRGEFNYEAKNRKFKYLDLATQSKSEVKQEDISNDRYKKDQADEQITRNDEILWIEMWGDLYDKDGYLLKKDMYAVVINRQFLCAYDTSPLAHKEIPIITCGLIQKPHSVYHESFISISMDSFEAWVEFLNLMLDFYTSRVVPQWERDVDRAVDPKDSTIGFPGAIHDKEGPEPLITPVQLGDVSAQIQWFVEELKRQRMDDSGLYEALSGSGAMPRRRMTSIEYTRRMSDAGSLFDFSFSNIESNYLEPILRQSFLCMLQYTSQEEWDGWIDNKISIIVESLVNRLDNKQPISDEQIKNHPEIKVLLSLKGMTPQERLKNFGKQIYFKTEVFSAVLDRQKEIEQVTYLLGVLGRIPMALPFLKLRWILGRLMKAMDYNEDEALRTDEEAMAILKIMSSMGLMKGYVKDEEFGTGGESNELNMPPPNAAEGMPGAFIGMGPPGTNLPGMNLPQPPA